MPDNADVYPVIVIDSDGDNTKTTIPSHQTEDTGSGFTLDTNEADSISSATLEAKFDPLESYLEKLDNKPYHGFSSPPPTLATPWDVI